ncbi:unnamed protein product [Haemonchus placei]|uniref:C2H2-type domain-containing protein n=1 Tax=Haemonchus placei TaxID=6290 RepID=A0A0N4WDG0_HAEPC|nr:unnamed protein product [Haemonchus placei]
MKEEYRKNTQSRANKLTVYCPVCGDRFVDHESLANHCNEKHSDEGANGVEQNYTVYSLTFQTKDEFEMKGCFGHIGHDIEPALLPLTEEQKQHLRHLLEGHSLEYVIRRMRSDFSPKTSRLHFVTKSDLRNIMQKYGMGPGLRNNNDLTSPQMQVDENNFDDGKQMLDKAEDPSGKRFTSGGKRRRLATASFRTQQTLTCHGSAVTHHEGKRLKIRSIARRKLEEGETSEKAHLAESNGQYGCEPGPSSNVEEAHSKTAKKEVVCKVQLAAADPMVHTQVQMELRKAWRSKIQMITARPQLSRPGGGWAKLAKAKLYTVRTGKLQNYLSDSKNNQPIANHFNH